MPFGCTLTNGLLGDPDLEAVVLYNGREVQSLVCTTEAKQLKMALKSGNKYITVNENSGAARRIEWSIQTIEKSASISENGSLVGENGAAGIVLVSLDNKTAMVHLESVDLAEALITPIIPDGGFVYDGTAKTPEIRFDLDEELTEGTDYTVSYLNNVSAGVASAVIVATEDGKCVGTKIVNYEIDRRNINDVNTTVELNEDDEPVIKLTLGEMTLAVKVDYTVAVTRDEEKKTTTFVIEGIGNFEDRLQIVLDDAVIEQLIEQENDSEPKSEDEFSLLHLLWIIPLSVIAVGGIAFAVVLIIKKKRGDEPHSDGGSDAVADIKEQE